MALSDYEHWNEEAAIVWWNEEGKHEPQEPDFEDDYEGWYIGEDEEEEE